MAKRDIICLVDQSMDAPESNERGHWGSKWEFVLSCVGLSVGIGNVWRFPYLAFVNGGGAFLIPYTVLLFLIGKPMYMMETALGQFSQLGPVAIWNLSPLFTGVGISMIMVSLIVSIYYNVIIAYTIYYMAASFTSELPWSKCQSWWGADQFCFSRSAKNNDTSTYYDIDEKILFYNGTRVCGTGSFETPCVNVTLQTAARQYWEKYVLGLKEDGLTTFGDLGPIRWQLLLCFLLSWIVVFLCVMKGVKSAGKVVYFTATFPYIVLIGLLIRGVTLDGAAVGLYYLFVPDWSKLANLQVWGKAAEQMFYSLSISWGGLIMFGSYNQFRNRVHVDAVIVSSLDFLTSIMAGIATFSILGAISVETGVDIRDIATSGPGFAFVTFPEAISRLPFPQIWSVLFFFMLFTLGLDVEFALVEIFLTCFYDKFTELRRYKVLLTAGACVGLFLLGLPAVTEAGNYVIDLMDTFGGGTGVFLVAIFEMVGIMWVYGVRNVARDFQFMLGFQPSLYWKICWALSPFLLSVIFITSMVTFQNPVMGNHPYPSWAISIGWALLFTVIAPVPITATIIAFKYWKKGKLKQILKATDLWGPGDVEFRENWFKQKQTDCRSSSGFENTTMDFNE